jgi:copper(I)-binding protein
LPTRPTRRPAAVTGAAAVAFTLAAVAVAVGGGCGGGGPADPATVTDAWAVDIDDGSSAAVYATITTSTADELTGAHVDPQVARRTAIVNPDDVASDEPGHLGHLDPGGSLNDDHSPTVALRPDTPVSLEPGHAYVALDLLAAPLEPGTTFEITLTFDNSPDTRAQVTVRPPPP